MPAAEVILTLQSQVAPQIAQTTATYTQLSAAEQKAEQGATRYALSLQKVALADAKTATEEQRLAVQTANAARAEDQAALSALRLASAQDKVAKGSSFGAQTADAFKSSILGIVGPMAIATATIGTLIATANSFKEAFVFKAGLDATTASIKSQLDGFRDVGQTYAEAAAFGRQYNITQEQTNSILQSSVGSLRSSTAGVAQLETALIRLQTKDVSKPISEAARALAELESGDVTSIKELFRVSAKDALGMRDAIVAGGDSVQVLTAYLDRTQTGMHALELRSQGVQGALNRAQIAAEDLTLAQAKFAEGPGTQFTEFWTNIVKETTAILSGDFTEIQARNQARIAGQQAYDAALRAGKDEATAYAAAQAAMQAITQEASQAAVTAAGAYNANVAAVTAATIATNISKDALSAEAQKKLDSTIATAQLTQQQAQLDADSRRAAIGLLGAGDQALLLANKYGIAATQAQFLINAQQRLSNATALADQRKGEQTGTDLSASQFNKFDKLADTGRAEASAKAKQDAKKAADEARQLADLKAQNQIINAKTSAQKIAVLNAQLAKTTDAIERQQIQNQIDQEKQSGAGRVGRAQSTALQLNQVEENSGAQLLKTQRENLERLRDQQLSFDIRRSRAAEDFQEDYQKLLNKGQRIQATALKEDFEKKQKRDREDFDIQKRQTLRNNAEATGDIGARADLRQQQIADRAALRGTAAGGARTPGGAVSPGALPAAGATASPRGAQPIAQITIQGVVNLDGKAVGTAIYPVLQVMIDQDLAATIAAINPPGSVQQAVAGVG